MWMMKRCIDFYFGFWGSVSHSWWSDHICWRRLYFGFFLCVLSACSSGCSYISFRVLSLLLAFFVCLGGASSLLMIPGGVPTASWCCLLRGGALFPVFCLCFCFVIC